MSQEVPWLPARMYGRHMVAFGGSKIMKSIRKFWCIPTTAGGFGQWHERCYQHCTTMEYQTLCATRLCFRCYI